MALLDNLFNTLEALQNRSYSPTLSLRFVAQKPKAREIHAAHFRDRVVHHWLVPRLEALYEPIFIHDVYSNRVGKGTHKACDRLQAFMHAVGNQGWYLQLDIRNFFNSIDRPILFRQIQHRLRKAEDSPSSKDGLSSLKGLPVLEGQAVLATSKDCPSLKDAQSLDVRFFLRWLVHVLLRHDTAAHSVYRGDPKLLQRVPAHKRLGHAGPHKGLPIGNLTSQFFANVYLNDLDQFVKHTLKCRHYLRYVDDFILVAESPEVLLEWRGQIETFLQQRLQLQLKQRAEPKPVKSGADFLGYIVYPHYRLVRRRVVGNVRECLNAFQARHIQGSVRRGYHIALETAALDPLRATLASYWGHFKHANSQRLCAAFFRHYPWLGLLFDEALQPRWQPADKDIVGYKSQLWFFRRQYPLAELRVQRGTEQDIIPADPIRPGDCAEPRSWVSRVIVREQRHCNKDRPSSKDERSSLKGLPVLGGQAVLATSKDCPSFEGRAVLLNNGLKRRLATRLFIPPGIPLCPAKDCPSLKDAQSFLEDYPSLKDG